jgi:hypothetical protein
MPPPTEIDFPNCVIKVNDSSNNSTVLSPISMRLTDSSGNILTQTPTSINFNNLTVYSEDTILIKGVTGTPNQILSIDNSYNMVWKDNLAGWTGTATTSLNMNNYDIIGVSGISGNTINLNTNVLLLKGLSGSSGQVLTVGATGLEWKTITSNATTPTLAQVMSQGNTATTSLNMSNYDIIGVSGISGNTINLNTNVLLLKGLSGSSGQVLTVGATGLEWKTITSNATTPTLAQVMSQGNTATTSLNMNNYDIIGVSGISGNTINLNTNVLLLKGLSGSSGQVLTVGATGLEWKTITSNATTPTLAQVMSQGNTATTSLNMSNYDIIGVSGISGNTINLNTNVLLLKGLSGSSGQVLTVGATGLEWKTITSNATTPTLAQVMSQGNTATTSLNMNNYDIIGVSGISGNTINLNTNSLLLKGLSGSSGQVLTVGATGLEWKTITSNATTPTLAQVMSQGNTATTSLNMNNYDIIGVSGISGNTINLNTNSLLLKGLSGSSGQVLTVGATGLEWKTITSNATTPTLSQVMSQGNTATTSLNMSNYDIIGVSGISGNTINLNTNSLLLKGLSGSSGQVLTVGATGLEWRNTYELVVKDTNIGAGTSVFENINTYTSQYIVGGYTAGPLTIYNSEGNTSTTLPLVTNSPASNIYIVKYTNGIAQWATFVNSKIPNMGQIPCIAIDSENNTYVTNVFNSTLYAYDAPGNTYTVNLNWTSAEESYIVKYNNTGIAQWATKLSNISHINSVIVDKNNDLIVTGRYTSGSLIYDAPGNTSRLSLSKIGSYDMFIIKYNSNGYALWAKHIGYTSLIVSTINYAAIDNLNNIIVNGIYDTVELTAFNDSTNTITASTKRLINPNTTPTKQSMFIVKYNDSAAIWATQMGSTGTLFYPTIRTDSANNIIASVGVQLNRLLTIQNSNGNTSSVNLPTSNLAYMAITKYSDTGYAQWATKIDNVQHSKNRYNIATDNEDIYAIVASGVAVQIFDVSGSTCVPTTLSTVNATITVLVKYNSSGIAQWRMNFNQSCYDVNVTTNDSYIYVTGQSQDTPLTIRNSDQSIGITLYNKVSNNYFLFMVTCSKNGFVQYANIIDDNSTSTITTTIHKITTNNINNNNTAFGNDALQNLQTGSNNIALGYNAGNSLIYGSNNIYIGNTGNSYENNTIRIGNSTDHTDAVISSNTINLNANSLLLKGLSGSSGQVLTIGATGLEWKTITSNATTPTLSQVMSQGNTASNVLNMNNFNIIGVSGISGNTINLQTNSLLLGGNTGTTGQIFSIGISGSPVWSSLSTITAPDLFDVMTKGNIASTSLNMGGNSITNAISIDANAVTLNVGTSTANGVTIGRSGQITDIQGNLQIGGAAGTNGQVLTSDGTTSTWADVPASTWVGTATTELNMDGNNITNAISLDANAVTLNVGTSTANGVTIGRSGQITDIQGNLQIGGAAGTNGQVLTSDGTTSTWADVPASTWVGTATTELNMEGNSITNAISLDANAVTLNVGTSTANGVTIGRSGQITDIQGNLQIGGAAGTNGQVLTSDGTTSTWADVPASTWIGTATTELNMDGNNITNAISIDANAVTLNVGTSTANGVTIGRSGQITDIQGNLQIGGAAGTNGQVLTSDGTTSTWADVPASTWIGTATTELNMDGNNITNAISIDANAVTLNVGTSTANGVTIGRSGQITDIQGNLQIGGAAGTNGQVLTSDGTTSTWADVPASTWVGTAVTSLNMNNFNIIGVSGISGNTINLNTDSLLLKGFSGSSGQVLSVGATGYPEWLSLGSLTTPSLSQVMTQGNIASTSLNMNNYNIIGVSGISGNTINLNTNSLLLKGLSGSSGQVLSVGATGYPEWLSLGSLTTPSLSQVMTQGNIASTSLNMNNYNIIGVSGISGNTINLNTNSLLLKGITGTTGQVLSVGSSGPEWRNTYELVVKNTNIGAGTEVINTLNTLNTYTNEYIFGEYDTGPLDIYNSDGNTAIILPSSTPAKNMYIVKYNNGFAQWATFVNSTNNNSIIFPCIAVDSLNNTYVTSTFTSNVNAYNAPGNTYTVSLNWTTGTESYIVKYNDNGIAQWATKLNPSICNIDSVIVDKNDNIVVTGRYNDTSLIIYDAPGNTSHLSLSKIGTYDMFIIKYNSNGYALWAKHIGNPGHNFNSLNYAVIDNLNNIIVNGIYSSSALTIYNDNTNSASTKSLTNATPPTAPSRTSFFVVKYNDNTALWAAQIGASGFATVPSTVQTDSANNIIVPVGVAFGQIVNIQNSNGNTSSINLPISTVASLCLIKYSDTGYAQWATKIDNIESTRFNIVTDKNDIYVILGTTNILVTTFDVSGNTCVVSPLPTSNITRTLLVKYNSNGIAQWRMNFNQISSNLTLSVNDSYVYVCGTTPATPLTIFNSDQTIGITLYNKRDVNRFGFAVTCSKDGFVQYANIIDSYAGGHNPHKIVTNNINSNNTSFGNYSLSNLSTGDNNTALGYNAGNNLINGSNNIYIGNKGNSYESNTIRIGNITDHTDAVITSTNSINLNANSLLLKGLSGSSGQVLTVSASGSPEWKTTTSTVTTTPTLAQVMSQGNTASTSLNMNNFNIVGVSGISGNTINLNANSLLLKGLSGSSGQVLTVGASGSPEWRTTTSTATTTPTLAQVMSQGNTASTSLNMNNFNIVGVSGISGNTINLNANSLLLKGLSGSSGQVLTVGASGSPEWRTTTSTLAQVMSQGNTASNRLNMNNFNIVGVSGISGNTINLNTNSLLLNGSTGSHAQILSVSASGSPEWASLSTITAPNLFDVMTKGNTVSTSLNMNNFNIVGVSGISGNTINLNANSLLLRGFTGTTGQVLTVGLTGSPAWRNINELTIVGTNIGVGNNIDSKLFNNSIVTVGQFTNTLLTVYNSDGTTGITMPNASILNEGFLLKYTEGYVDWISRISGIQNQTVNYVAIDKLNNIIVGGSSTENMVLYNSDGTVGGSLTIPSFNAFLIKYNNEGYIQWATILNTTDIFTIATDNKNNIIVGGRTNNNQVKLLNSNGTTGFTFPTIASSSNNGYLAKYSDTGYAQWGNYITGNLDEFITSVAVDSNNNILIAGYYLSNALSLYNSNGNIGATLPGVISQNDSFLAKYSDTGYIQWVNNIYGSSNKNITNSVVVDSKNNVIIGGYYSPITSLVYNPDRQVGATLTNTNTNNNGFLVKYSDTGYVQWATKIAGNANDAINSVKIDSKDNIIVGGQYTSNSVILHDANGAASITKMGTIGGWDGIVAKYSDTGYAQWASNVGGINNDIITTVSIDNDNNIFVGGYFNSNVLTIYNSNSTINSVLLNNTTNTTNNGFLIKYNDIGNVQWSSNIDSGTDGTVFVNSIANIKNNNDNNAALGNGALAKLKHGYNNISLGYNAGNNLITGYNNIYIGNTGKTYDNNTIRIGNSADHTNAVITSSNSINLNANSLLLRGSSGARGQVLSVSTTGSPEWRDMDLIVKNNNIGAGTNVFNNLTSNSSTPYIYVCGNYVSALTLRDFNNNIQTTLGFSGGNDTYLIKYNDNGKYIWGTRIAGVSNEQSSMFAIDTYNNTYLYGYYNSSTINIPITGYSGGNDTYLIKYNDNGDVLWVNNVGGGSDDFSKKIIIDSSNNIYVTGIYNSSQLIIHDTTVVDGSITNYGINYNTYLIKYNSNGNIQWTNRIGGTGVCESPNVFIDSLNNVYLCGNYTFPISITGQNGSTILGNTGNNDTYIVKYNSIGNIQWTNRINGTGNELSTNLTIDNLNNIYLCGDYSSQITITSQPGSTSLVSPGLDGIYIVKYNSNGVVQYANSITGTTVVPINVNIDNLNNVYIIGYYTSSITINGVNGTTGIPSGSVNNDIFVVKYNTTGNIEWTSRMYSAGVDGAIDLTIDSLNNVYVTGYYTTSTLTIDGINSTRTLTNSGGIDTCLVKYNSNGNIQWAAKISGVGQDEPVTINNDEFNNIYLTFFTGSANATLTDGKNNTYNISTTPGNDGCIVKYDTNGALQWINKISGITNNVSPIYSKVKSISNTNNTTIGINSLSKLEYGNNNIALGSSAGSNLIHGSNNIYIGANDEPSYEHNTIRMGNSQLCNDIYIGNKNSTTTILGNFGEPMAPNYAYNATTGTNIVGTIGYIYQQLTPTPANNSSFGASPSGITYGTISIPVGIWLVAATMTILGSASTNLVYVQSSISSPSATEYVNRILQVGGVGQTLYYSISGVVPMSSPGNIICAIYLAYSGSAPLVQHTGFRYRITRIA